MKNSEQNPKISVIVPVYNHERFIGRCLRSLLHQTLPHTDYEIIVVDDGSTDLTSYALQLFCDNSSVSIIKLIRNKKNIGLSASLNKALYFSNAPYVVRVDSDDFVNINFLNFLHYFLKVNEYADAVACDYQLVDDKEKVLKRCNCNEEPIACGIMFRKEQLFDIGLYNESLRIHEERELRERFKDKYKILRLEVPLYRYRRHDKNITKDSELAQYKEWRKMFNLSSKAEDN